MQRTHRALNAHLPLRLRLSPRTPSVSGGSFSSVLTADNPDSEAPLYRCEHGTGTVGLQLPESHTHTICMRSYGAGPNSTSLMVNGATQGLQVVRAYPNLFVFKRLLHMREVQNMELARARNLEAQKPRVQTKPDEYGGDVGSDCTRALAEAERVLREVSALCTRRSGPQRSSSPAQFGVFDLRLERAMPDRLPLDPGLDFVVHDDGSIDLTEAGFRRMAQAHSAGLDAVIWVDRHDLLRFPARSRE
jgi:hypothetical protein